MFQRSIAFDAPWFLLLLLALPVLWWSGYRTLAGLGRVRRWIALALRTIVYTLLVLALAEVQFVRTSDKVTVLYLLDQSLSIPETQRREMIRYVNESIRRQRDKDREDRAGVIVFGREASVEIPPIDEHLPVEMKIESLLDPEYTDLAGAMKTALALFPHDSSKRVVLLSDGNENLGDARQQAQALIDAGVSIDVVPIRRAALGEVSIDKLAVSTDVRRGQPFDLRVVLNNMAQPKPGQDGQVKGKLKLTRRVGNVEETLPLENDGAIALRPGKSVISLREEIDQPDFYTYEAQFIPDDPARDAMPQNNRATTFTHVRGRGHVLLIEDWANKGEFAHLIERLRNENLEVTLQASDELFTGLSELQRYDTVIMANVPRSSSTDDSNEVTNFSDEQISMLVRNTQQMGSGLVMIGGPNSFGAGGWTNTELEKAMPVDFQVKSAKVAPVGALALLMHASEMAQGNHWQKVVGREAIKALGDQDYCGLLHWNGNDQWLWGRPRGMIKVGPNRKLMLANLDRMVPGDMPQFDPAMVLALNEFKKLNDAAIKHMIIISDGDPAPPDYIGTIPALKALGVKISTVAIGTHGPPGSTPMQQIATATGGKYYVVNNPKALPRIYQQEDRRVARPLIFYDKAGFKPYLKFPHEMLKGLGADIPPITGFVLTTIKDSPLVEVSLVSPKPSGEENATVLASWTYGLGRAVALTTDAGHGWATAWKSSPSYDKLFGQIVRWSMRPVNDSGKFTVATDVEDGRGRIIITALDKDDEFLNFLDMSGSVVGPGMKPVDMQIRQTAPGRYVGEFAADDAGSYFLMINPGPGQAPIRTGINVAYSDEFRDRESNIGLLETIAALKPAGGEPGHVIEDPSGRGDLERLLAVSPFRRDLPRSTASQDIWHLLLLAAALLFFYDVFNRRVQINLAWMRPYAARLRDKFLRREPAPQISETLDRLRSRKAAVGETLDQRRAAARFEPTPDQPADLSTLQEQGSAVPLPKPDRPQDAPPAQAADDSYTERLLKAKKKMWDERK